MTMREKIARALRDVDVAQNRAAVPDRPHVEPTGKSWTLYLPYVDAALESLMGPTEAMNIAGLPDAYKTNDIIDRVVAMRLWDFRQMIQAAKEDK